MKEFISYLTSNWYAAAGLALLIVVTVVAWIKACSAGKKRSAERDRIIAELEEEKALRKQFKVIDENTFSDDTIDDERLLFGTAMNVQMSIEKKDDLITEFNGLCEEKRMIYALNFVFEDSKYEKLSLFFRSNGEPLLSQAKEAVEKIIGGELSKIFDEMFLMMNEDVEDVSFDKERVEKLDEEFKTLMQKDKDSALRSAADYIRENKSCFISSAE